MCPAGDSLVWLCHPCPASSLHAAKLQLVSEETKKRSICLRQWREWGNEPPPSTQRPLPKDENCLLLPTWGGGSVVRCWIYKAFTFISFKPRHKPARETGAGEMLFIDHKSWARYSAKTMHTAQTIWSSCSEVSDVHSSRYIAEKLRQEMAYEIAVSVGTLGRDCLWI